MAEESDEKTEQMPKRLPDTLTELEMFCIDGWAANGDYVSAYKFSRKNAVRSEGTNLRRAANIWRKKTDVQAYYTTRRQLLTARLAAAETENRTKSDAIAELNNLITSTTDAKTKADLIVKLAEIQQWKKQQDDAEKEKQVQFYIPLPVEMSYEYIRHRMETELELTKKQKKILDDILKTVEPD